LSFSSSSSPSYKGEYRTTTTSLAGGARAHGLAENRTDEEGPGAWKAALGQIDTRDIAGDDSRWERACVFGTVAHKPKSVAFEWTNALRRALPFLFILGLYWRLAMKKKVIVIQACTYIVPAKIEPSNSTFKL
jgi:hypothetical protein